MTLAQVFAFAIVIGMMALFVWGRLRYDLVALLALLASIVTGIVAPERAFTGFSDEIVIIIASALLVSAAVARSGVVETALRWLGPYLVTPRMQILVLVTAVTALAAFVKNIGALAMLIPVAFQIARRSGTPASYFLMPMAFGSLLGGLTTLVGTSPNIIVSRMRDDLLGEPFRMFDFTPVGLGIAATGIVFLVLAYRLLPVRKGAASIDAAFNIEGYVTEARLPADSSLVGKTVADLEALSEGEVNVTAIIRERFRRYTPADHWTLQADDLLILEGEPAALEQLVARARLKLVEEKDAPAAAGGNSSDEIGVIEAVVTAESPLVDRSPAQVRLAERYQLKLLAISRSGARITHRLRSTKFRPGDVIVLQGNLNDLPEALGELRCLPLAERGIRLGRGRQGILPVVVLACAMVLVALHLVPVSIAFFGAAVLLILLGSLTLREAYEVIDWPILILVGALIPVSEAVRTTGGTDLIAAWLSAAASALPPMGALALILVAAMAVTPFLNNAATVLVVAPIAASMATNLGFNPDPFLMAVALGAGCDFLTPIGHQCNTLVMGPGGYRFEDYWRLGLPLSALVVIVGVPLIALVWPISG
ncbi:SLC13 family permease [Rhodoligotrophos defluvii]|uniref:SLC13 family permease n=1 Tax=Rhodoligotrophos defluvii TaxID=2561934 RepID=UPI0010C976CB|nr:SLC13 family permease [Rhodoligotrophos defluvii]